MSDTYTNVTAKGEEHWQFDRSLLVAEFKDTKPPLPPPLNIIWIVFRIVRSAYRRYINYDGDSLNTGYKKVPSAAEFRRIFKGEQDYLQLALSRRRQDAADSMDNKLDSLRDEVR